MSYELPVSKKLRSLAGKVRAVRDEYIRVQMAKLEKFAENLRKANGDVAKD